MEQCWRIELLGQLRACLGDQRTVPFQIEKSGALLAYLAYHTRHPQPRELIVELLWPEEDPEEARRKLRFMLHSLRRQLPYAASPGGSLLIAERTTLRLDPAALTTDVAEFRNTLQAAADPAQRGRRLEHLTTAVALYRGELLPGYYEGMGADGAAGAGGAASGGAATPDGRPGSRRGPAGRARRGPPGGERRSAGRGGPLRRDAPRRGAGPALRRPSSVPGAGAAAGRRTGGNSLGGSASPG